MRLYRECHRNFYRFGSPVRFVGPSGPRSPCPILFRHGGCDVFCVGCSGGLRSDGSIMGKRMFIHIYASYATYVKKYVCMTGIISTYMCVKELTKIRPKSSMEGSWIVKKSRVRGVGIICSASATFAGRDAIQPNPNIATTSSGQTRDRRSSRRRVRNPPSRRRHIRTGYCSR
jgi:hypothetical protein